MATSLDWAKFNRENFFETPYEDAKGAKWILFFHGFKPANPFAPCYKDNPFKWHMFAGVVLAQWI